MVLPLTVNDGNYTLADHAAWHAEIDTLVPFLGLPDTYTHVAPGTTNHRRHHGALNNMVDDTLGTDLIEYQLGHYAMHEATHAFLTTTPVVNLTTASNVPAALSAQPAGAVFGLAAGTYRQTAAWAPKSNQRLVYAYGAESNGAVVLTSWTQAGSDWWTARPGGAAGAQSDLDRCSITGCRNRHDVFVTISGVVYPLVRVASLAAMAAGTFFEDFAAARVYVRLGGTIPGSTSPNDHLMEQAYSNRLIVGGSAITGVRVENGRFVFSANAEQDAAVDCDNDSSSAANGWLIDKCDILYNHGGGAIIDGSTIRRSRIAYSGQLGLGGHGINPLVEDVELDHNNRDNAYAWIWEGGGMKVAISSGLVVRRVHAHDNNGPGLWTDINNGETLYEDCYTARNLYTGIFHEISYAVIIRRCVGDLNGEDSIGNGFYSGAQILVSASPGSAFTADVYDNVVRGKEGIGGLQQNRLDSPDARGAHEVWNLDVHDNIGIRTATGTFLGGINQDVGDTSVFTSRNNRWRDNTYYAPTTTGSYFTWMNGGRSLATMQGTYSQELGSTISASGAPSMPAPPVLPTGPRGSLS